MASPGSAALQGPRPTWRLYLELTKPKVVALIVFTAINLTVMGFAEKCTVQKFSSISQIRRTSVR